ncbi:MAG: hypothetical protein AAFY17_18240, partial [Cyanobacteria bacterium J06642_11]
MHFLKKKVMHDCSRMRFFAISKGDKTNSYKVLILEIWLFENQSLHGPPSGPCVQKEQTRANDLQQECEQLRQATNTLQSQLETLNQQQAPAEISTQQVDELTKTNA